VGRAAWQFIADILPQRIGPVLIGQAVQIQGCSNVADHTDMFLPNVINQRRAAPQSTKKKKDLNSSAAEA
jgi:hypothetical protein